jgi:hypothetical protein
VVWSTKHGAEKSHGLSGFLSAVSPKEHPSTVASLWKLVQFESTRNSIPIKIWLDSSGAYLQDTTSVLVIEYVEGTDLERNLSSQRKNFNLGRRQVRQL